MKRLTMLQCEEKCADYSVQMSHNKEINITEWTINEQIHVCK